MWSSKPELALAALLLPTTFTLSCEERTPQRVTITQTAAVEYQKEPIQVLSPPARPDPPLVELGGRLFFDPILSADGTLSCASCHDIGAGGEDGKSHSIGIRGVVGRVNAPSVLNAANNFVQFWDGRAATLEEQAGGPITDPIEMGSSWPDVLRKLQANPSYVADFGAHVAEGLSAKGVEVAIAAFERTLITVDSRFDQWLSGNRAALTSAEVDGYERFKTAGCIACHQGQNVGGNMFQRFGVMGDYFADRGNVVEADYGRFNVTHQEADRYVFRVPSLRNVELTAPYFHDGTAATLPDAVRVMAKYQLGRELSETDVGNIVAFLKTLTGRVPDTSHFERASAKQ
jgi:cytochrome c peroxidase